MCHKESVAGFPDPGSFAICEAQGLLYRDYGAGEGSHGKRVMILTDIYGCNNFYQSFATYLMHAGWNVHLIDLFSPLGELKEVTREAAFERRHLLQDRKVCDQLEAHAAESGIEAVIGFCLGANYVLEFARRGVPVSLVGYYPFPAGLPNQDELEIPLDYAANIMTPVTLLVGDSDDSSGRDNMAKLYQLSVTNPALQVHVFEGSGHGFLADLDSSDEDLKRNAKESLNVCERVIGK